MAHSTTSWSSISRRFLDAFLAFTDLPQPPPPFIKGVFPLTKSSLCTFDSSHKWLEAILDNESSQMNRCSIEQVVHYKRTDRKEHEFIVLQVGLVDSPQKACIIAERTVPTQDKIDKSASSSKSSPPPSHDPPAVDIITCAFLNSEGHDELARRWRLSGCKPVRKLTFDRFATRPSVLEVAILVKVTSSHAPPYSLFQNQCYWFAATVVEAMMMLFPIALRSVEPPRRSWVPPHADVPAAENVSQICAVYRNELRVVRNQIAEVEGTWEEARWQQRVQRMRQEARDEARVEGHAEGRAEGLEQGRAEERAALERERAALDARERELTRRTEALEALEARTQVQVSD